MPFKITSCSRCGKESLGASMCKPCRTNLHEEWRIKNGLVGGYHASMPWFESIKIHVDKRSLSSYTVDALSSKGQQLINCPGCNNTAIIPLEGGRCHRCEGKSKSEWEKSYITKEELERAHGYMHKMPKEGSDRNIPTE